MGWTPGGCLLRFRRKFGHGLRVAWYRDVVRKKILKTRPIAGLVDKRCEIHALTCAQDWLNLMWTLKSFYAASGRKYALCIHEDGTLTSGQLQTFREHFPEARIIGRKQADNTMLGALAGFPRCQEFRSANFLSLKLFDFAHFLRSERLLQLDSDVLFFRKPVELLRRIEDGEYRKNSVNRDVASAYAITPDAAQKYGNVTLAERFNSGLGLIHRASLRLDWLEEFLAIPGLARGHFWRIEQTLAALCSSRFGHDWLPAAYDVALQSSHKDRPVRHYVGAIRPYFYREGIRELNRRGLRYR